MSFRNLLVYLDGGERAEAVMRAAIDVAHRHQARLSGLHVIGYLMPTDTGMDPSSTTHPIGASGTLATIRAAGLAAACRAEAVFKAQLLRAGLAGDWTTAEGMVAYTAGRYARNFDMAIVGQVDPAHPPLGSRKFVPEALFLESGRPVVIIPHIGAIERIGSRVVIGWDGGREAARAVNDAIPFLTAAESVTVVTIVRQRRGIGYNRVDPVEMVSHLAWHGIRATGVTENHDRGCVAERLLARAADADLLVVGGYAHSRIREWVVGGVTRHILRAMTVPVLMSH